MDASDSNSRRKINNSPSGRQTTVSGSRPDSNPATSSITRTRISLNEIKGKIFDCWSKPPSDSLFGDIPRLASRIDSI